MRCAYLDVDLSEIGFWFRGRGWQRRKEVANVQSLARDTQALRSGQKQNTRHSKAQSSGVHGMVLPQASMAFMSFMSPKTLGLSGLLLLLLLLVVMVSTSLHSGDRSPANLTAHTPHRPHTNPWSLPACCNCNC
jgi:hypothetical protein